MKTTRFIQNKFITKFSLLLALVLGVGWLSPDVQAQQTLRVDCNRGIGNVSSLIRTLNFANADSTEEIIELGENCVYTLTKRHLNTNNGLPVIRTDLVIEGKGATIQRDPSLPLVFFRLMAIDNQARVTLRNLTLQNGSALFDNGGAILANAGVDLTLINVDFINNRSRRGGAIFTAGESTVIRNSRFTNNQAPLERGGALFTTGALTLIDSSFTTNKARAGGGLYSEGTVSISGSRFEGNNATAGDGGGLYGEGAVSITGSNFVANRAKAGGGLYGEGVVNISESRFEGNNATSDGGGLFGNAEITLVNSEIINNKASNSGGGISTPANITMSGGQVAGNTAINGGGLAVEGKLNIDGTEVVSNTANKLGGGVSADTAVVKNSRFENNRALTSSGGGLAVSDLTLRQTTVLSNSAFSGGGVFVNRRTDLRGSAFIRNQAVDGAGLALTSIGGNHDIINNLWLNNIPSKQGAVITLITTEILDAEATGRILHNTVAATSRIEATAIFRRGKASFILRNNIITNYEFGIRAGVGELPVAFQSISPENPANPTGGDRLDEVGTITADHNIYFNNTTNEEGSITSSNNREVDPLFVDPANGNYHLQAGSPAIDKGLNAEVTDDVEGMIRPQGEGYDIGAYEWADTPSDPDNRFSVYLPLLVKG